ncbi:hypothetical protein ACFQ3Z_02345 [Streptomyces nogalater]
MPTFLTRTRTGLLASAVAAALAVTAAAPRPRRPRHPAGRALRGPPGHHRRTAPREHHPGTRRQRRRHLRLQPPGRPYQPRGHRARTGHPARTAYYSTTPALTSPFLGGIVRAHDGTLYFLYATGSSDLTGLWRLRPGGTPQRIAALPADGLPNGLALDRHEDLLYIADSVLGTVWRVPVTGGTPTRWATGPALAATGFLGANGIKVHHGAVWVSNLDQGTVLRVPVTRQGRPTTSRPGRPAWSTSTTSRSPATATPPRRDQRGQRDRPGRARRPAPGGAHRRRRTGEPDLLAVRGTTAYIASGAYFTNDDPNLLAARIAPRR